MHAPNQYYSVVVTDLLHDRLMLKFFSRDVHIETNSFSISKTADGGVLRSIGDMVS